jgi:DNA polymerase-2
MSEKGFLLTSKYIDDPVHKIILYGSADFGPFKCIFDNKPVFFIESDSKFPPLFECERKKLSLKSFSGLNVDALYFDNQKILLDTKEKLSSLGIRSYEADVRAPERFLMERFIFACIEFNGEYEVENNLRVYKNPQIQKTDYNPKLNSLSLDIETGVAGDVYSIGMHFKGPVEKKLVIMISDNNSTDDYIEYVRSEKMALLRFQDVLKEWDPDLIFGWHVIGFDLMFLQKRFLKYGLVFSIGRSNTSTRLDDIKGAGFFARVDGRVVIDGPPALRSAFYSFENFKLQTVAKEILGVGKDISSDSGKVDEIERRFKEDKEALAKYNLLDCTLVSDIYEKIALVDHIVTRSKVSGLMMDRIGVSTAAFDHFMLPQIHRKGYVASNVSDITRDYNSGGGLVINPTPGVEKNIIILDFKSLYPTIMRTFRIDPYSLLKNDVNTISTPCEINFSGSEYILPDKIKELMTIRENAKFVGNTNLSQAVKILMNSFYGVMGSSRSRFYHSDLPHAITSIGQWVLKMAIEYFENKGREVVYGDTDSVFVKLTDREASKIDQVGQELADEVTQFLSAFIKSEYKVTSYLEMEFEKHFDKIFFSPARDSAIGAKKRYVGLSSGEMEFKGMEYVRSDWTKLAKEFQFQLFEKYFSGENIEQFIKNYILRIEQGEFDGDLYYTKRLTKDPKEYLKNVPPHVKAALQINHKGPYRLKSVTYLMTKEGAVPIQKEPTDIDYQHYIDKQIAPLADAVLTTMGKSFDGMMLGDQLSLF